MRVTLWMLALAGTAALNVAGGGLRAQDSLVGPWTGRIDVAGITLQMTVVFSRPEGALAATIDIPQQGAAGIALREVRQDGTAVHFELPAGPGVATFDGVLEGDTIRGDFMQGGAKGTFELARGTSPPAPEAPAADLPYDVEDVTFGHGDVRLAGTVTTPRGAGPFPAVVLISGSGAQTRDEDVAGFKVFGTLADALTRAGIAVLRYDDRGVGGSSGPTDVTTPDYAADVEAGVGLLAARPGIDSSRIGLVGHSEGALVASLLAGQSDEVAYIVLMAGTTVTGERIVRGQAEAIARAAGAGEPQIAALRSQQDQLFEAVRTGEGWDAIEARAREQGRAQVAMMPAAQREALGDPEAYIEGVIQRQLAGARSPWYRYFIDYDPAPALRAVDVPVMGLFGGKDLQVLVDDNRPGLEAAFAGEREAQLTVRTYADANHLFQAAETGAPAEYATLDKAFVEGFAAEMAEWILSQRR